VLNKEPAPIAELTPDLPKELERIVARCIRKDLERRSQSIAEIKIALEELKEETESGVSAKVAPGVKPRPARWRWAALAAALAAAAAAYFLLAPGREKSAAWTEGPLTSFPGFQGEPTLSPDGSQFAFVWDGGHESAPLQLYVSLVGRGTPLRLTNSTGAAVHAPAWSPDGQTIAFVRVPAGKNVGDLILIPALGGPERKVDEVAGAPAWSSDSKWLYFPAFVAPTTTALFVESTMGGEKHRLTEPPLEMYGDVGPSISTDGRHVAFVRRFADFSTDLFVADLRDANTLSGTPRRLTNDRRTTSGPHWTEDGQDIVYIGGESLSLLGIYRVRASGGAPRRVQVNSGDFASSLALAPKGRRLVFGRAFRDYNMYRLPLPVPGAAPRPPEKFLSSTRFEETPVFSPDLKRVVFSSNRSGVRQIWLADADGSNPVALTSFTGGVAGSPRWSPDSQTIAFDARPEGLADIYSISLSGGAPKRLTDHPAEDHIPCFSTDGRWIYFASTRTGQRQLYRMAANGGPATQITRKGAYTCAASPDGKWIYYSRPPAGLWKVPVDGGEETQVAEVPALNNPFAFTVAASGIYFCGLRDPASGSAPLKLYRFSDDKVVELGRFDKILRLGLSVSPDEKWLGFTQLDSSVDDLILVEGFR